MKSLLIFISIAAISLIPSVYASEVKSIECFFDGGGYDDEYIFLSIKEDGTTLDFKYESYRGELPGFQKLSERVYGHSLDSEKIYTVVSFNKDLSKASMLLNYKANGEEFFRQDFVCK